MEYTTVYDLVEHFEGKRYENTRFMSDEVIGTFGSKEIALKAKKTLEEKIEQRNLCWNCILRLDKALRSKEETFDDMEYAEALASKTCKIKKLEEVISNHRNIGVTCRNFNCSRSGSTFSIEERTVYDSYDDFIKSQEYKSNFGEAVK